MINEESRIKIKNWLIQIKNGNADAAEELFEFIKVEVKRIARLYLKNYKNDEEILSEVFLRIGYSIQTFNVFKDGYNWIYAITKNTALSFNENERKNGTAVESEIIESVPAQSDSIDDVEMQIFLEQAMAKMDERDRQITTLLYVNELSQTEIAQIMHMSESAVSQRKAKILRFLAKFLKTP